MEETVESLKEKCRTLEAECHSLLNRAIKSEQQHVDAAAERDRAISAQNELRDEKAVLQKKVNEMRRENEDIAMNLAQLNEAMGDRDILATLEQYKADARRLNELRLKLESNFADLSVQYDTLQGEHELMSADYKSKTRDLETTLEHVSNLEGNIKALETAAAQAESDREAAYKNLELVRKELAAEVKAHLKTKDDLKRSQNSLADLRKELEGALEAAEKQKKDHDSLKKKAATWKKQAELAQELETRNEQLVVQLAYQTKELADAKALISKLQAQLVNLEEEEKKRRDNSINPKMVQYLRDQLAEAQEKIKEYKAKDKRQTELIATLEAQVKRLKLELGRKNPSQLRLMEMEVQNELLIGMLQASSPHRQPAAAKPAKSGATPPPRKLPPLESLVTAQTQTSASPTPGRVSPVPAPIIVKSTDTLKPSLAKQPTPRSLPTTPPSVAAAPSATTNSAAVAKSPKTLGATAAPPPAADTANTSSSSAPPAAAEETAAADRTTADLAAAPPPAAAAPVEPSPPPPSAAPSAPQSTGNKAPKASTDDDEAEGEEEGEEEEEADDAAGGAEEDGAGAEEGDDNEEEEEEYEEDAEAEDP